MAAQCKTYRARLLLVDDDPIILASLNAFLASKNFDVTIESSALKAMDHLKAGRFDVVISDVCMPQVDGFELLKYVRASHHQTPVVILTGLATVESAVAAMKLGAFDYIAKSGGHGEVLQAVERALEQPGPLADNRRHKAAPAPGLSFEHLLGTDARMAKVFDLIDAVAAGRTTVLITGESGTGKSLVARAIHHHSPRKNGPFVEVSCGALPESLLESELFGHIKGAFMHAVADRAGKFAAAEGGTIFLDEISSASPHLQAKLLRVLQERRFEPVGSDKTCQCDARVILATNHDLALEMEAGRFRSDLFYRINVVNIELPPLRERVDDIALLAEHFLAQFSQSSAQPIAGFSPKAIQLMQRYLWPGNVRELENCVERAAVLCRQNWIEVEDLAPAVGASAGKSTAPVVGSGMSLESRLAGPEKQIIQAALKSHHGNRQMTADELGINRTTLYKKMKKYGLGRA